MKKLGGANPKIDFNKIFVIGLTKTGKHSTMTALKELGFKYTYFGLGTEEGKYMIEQLKSGDYNLEIMDRYDCMVDIQASFCFAQLDLAFPNSKFILTTRDTEKWLKDTKIWWMLTDDSKKSLTQGNGFIKTAMYGTWKWNYDRFKYVKERHEREVKRWFKKESDINNLLVFDVEKGADEEKWEKLANFLGVEVPDKSFPFIKVRKSEREKLGG